MGPGHSIPIGDGEVGPPRSGFVLRLCIRKADEAWGEAALGHGLADTRFCRRRTAEWTDIGRYRWRSPFMAGPGLSAPGPIAARTRRGSRSPATNHAEAEELAKVAQPFARPIRHVAKAQNLPLLFGGTREG